MNPPNRPLFATTAVLVVAAAAAAQPTITEISNTEFPRSGRIAIEGSGFGAEGTVLVDGLDAWTSTWTDARIVAYIPETAPLGTAALSVSVAGQPSNEVFLEVIDRQTDGRVRWTFEADATNLWWRPALAPDGTIYLHTNNETDGLVYALTPDGGLMWVQKVNWNPYGPHSAGPDGAVYVGSIGSAYRISPQGEIDWEFHPAAIGDGIHMVPHAGPDGMLYGAYQAGIGAYSLEPLTGELLWSNVGDPIMLDWVGHQGTEAVFGWAGPGEPIDRYYITMEWQADIHAMSLDGEQLWARGIGNEATEPAIGSDGTIYIPAILARYIMALDPNDGSTLWQFQPGGSAQIRGIQIDADDILYYFASGKLQALNPYTQSLVWSNTVGAILNEPTLSPDGSTLVTSGITNYGQPGFIKGYSAETGEEVWHIDLPGEVSPADRVIGTHQARITPDSATAYLSTYTASWNPTLDTTSFLYAIDLGDGTDPGLPGDADGDGSVNVEDLIMIFTQWGPCPEPPTTCDADVDGNGMVNVNDLLMVMLNWS